MNHCAWGKILKMLLSDPFCTWDQSAAFGLSCACMMGCSRWTGALNCWVVVSLGCIFAWYEWKQVCPIFVGFTATMLWTSIAKSRCAAIAAGGSTRKVCWVEPRHAKSACRGQFGVAHASSWRDEVRKPYIGFVIQEFLLERAVDSAMGDWSEDVQPGQEAGLQIWLWIQKMCIATQQTPDVSIPKMKNCDHCDCDHQQSPLIGPLAISCLIPAWLLRQWQKRTLPCFSLSFALSGVVGMLKVKIAQSCCSDESDPKWTELAIIFVFDFEWLL